MSQGKVKKKQNIQRKGEFPYCLAFFFQLHSVVLTIAPNRPQAIAAPCYTTLETHFQNKIHLASNFEFWHQKKEKTC